MKRNAGLWIDHREAIIVVLHGAEEDTKCIQSKAEKQLRRLGEPDHGHFEAHNVPADDSQQREYDGEMARYYDEIISYLHNEGEILIFGPGEAKGELKKRFEAVPSNDHVIELKTTDKLTEPQVVEMVRHYLHSDSPRL